MPEYTPMTQDAYDKKKAEVDYLENVELPRIVEALAAAREEGDLKENAEYHGQKEAQGMLVARINQMKSQLALAKIVDPSQVKTDEVGFGAEVTVYDEDLEEEEVITLVGAGDEDYDKGKYLISSPIGKGLVGRKVGDTVEVKVPKGTINFKILKIEYPGY
jgi:transcription elongation factor GreA